MTNDELDVLLLDVLLGNAKPSHPWDGSYFWAACSEGKFRLPDDVFYRLSGGILWFGDYREYPTEDAAMDALRAAVAAYKQSRQVPA